MNSYSHQDWNVVVLRKPQTKTETKTKTKTNKQINHNSLDKDKEDKKLNYVTTDDAKYIINTRCKLKLTQDDLAKQSGVCVHEIKKMENPNSKYVKNNNYNKLRNFLYKKNSLN
jgi:ribosome-binding protein aMBF1 (putative translation factor)